MSLRLRDANFADAPLLRRWSDEPHVRAVTDDDWGWETELGRMVPWRAQLIAEVAGGGGWRPIGFVQIIDPAREDSHYWGDVPGNLRAIDIWIGEADALGQGHGTTMMRAALARCFAAPDVEAVIIDPPDTNVDAQRFYRRLGFVADGVRVFGEDRCLVMRLTRARYGQA